jgi:hypothetical protein
MTDEVKAMVDELAPSFKRPPLSEDKKRELLLRIREEFLPQMLPKLKEFWEHHRNGRTKALALMENFGKMRESDQAMAHAFLVLEVMLHGWYPLHKGTYATSSFWTPLNNIFGIEKVCQKLLGLEIPWKERDINSVEMDDIFLGRINELLSQGKTDGQPHP